MSRYDTWDWEAEAEGLICSRRMMAPYSRTFTHLEDGTWYWHAFLRGERVNGGLSETLEDARADSARAIALHACHR